MSKHLDLLREQVEGSALRLSADAIGFAVAITDREFITAKAGMIRRWSRVERFPLEELVDLRAFPNPSANLLQLQFSGASRSEVVTIMYPPESAAAFERLIAILRDYITENQRRAESHDEKS
ncbi:MAG: hypothetical protein N3C12_10770 [Candidatus Binatia bacterium]|nr:hypothetical protein [Candidatus Binatia bacterium]